ncbi:hypothetical protein JL720_1687 [Aureococcus anophagefferens]|nr:hypothetical protein JL720_1687 [Aureococcus anophagefferens]
MRVLLALLAVVAAASDYYKTLGIDKKATKKEVKAAYRTLALKWHPDKNPDDRAAAEQKFREVAEAYEVLSDDEQRRQYDSVGGIPGFGGGGRGGRGGPFGGGFRNADDIFKDFFGTSDPFADFEKIFERMDAAGDGGFGGGGADPFASMFGAAFGGMGGGGFGGMGGSSTFSFSSSTMTSAGGKTVTKTMRSSTDSSGRTTGSASLEESVGGKRTRRVEKNDDGNRRRARVGL